MLNDTITEIKISNATRLSYFDYKLAASQKFIKIMFLIAGLFNIILLLPDVILISDPLRNISLIILRIFFSLSLLATSIQIKKIKTFRSFSLIISGFELAAILLFLFVLRKYENPNFLIQTLGMITIIIVVFFIPNRWSNMLIVSLSGTISFLFSALFIINNSVFMEFAAAISYLSITIVLCSINAWNMEKHQLREYATKVELEHIGSIDYLTNAANRFKMEEEADRWISFCNRQGFPLAIVFIDVDDLKTINDQYGHFVGDSVLASMANIIQNQLRSADLLARWGGDEFIILLPNISFENAVILTERIRESIINNTFVIGRSVTCTFGVVEMKDHATFETMINDADNLMYKGKKTGKNTVSWNS